MKSYRSGPLKSEVAESRTRECWHGKVSISKGWINNASKKAAIKMVTCSEARSALISVLDRVHEDAVVAVISRRDGADAVVMSLDSYQSIMKTMHLLYTPANAAHLAKSIAQHRADKAARRELVKG